MKGKRGTFDHTRRISGNAMQEAIQDFNGLVINLGTRISINKHNTKDSRECQTLDPLKGGKTDVSWYFRLFGDEVTFLMHPLKTGNIFDRDCRLSQGWSSYEA